MDGCWFNGEGSTSPGERLVEARVCCTVRIVCASADSAAALETRLARYAARAFKYSFFAASVLLL